MNNLKFVFVLVIACLMSFTSSAQEGTETCKQWDGSCRYDNWPIKRKGSVHIGDLENFAYSNVKLQVTGNTFLKGHLRGLSQWNEDFTISASSPESSPGSYIHMYGTDHKAEGSRGDINITTRGASGEFSIKHNIESSWITNLSVKKNGKVTIGDGTADASDGFLLAVGQGIQTQQLKVCASASSWCDYVFAENYKRNSLTEVEKFIKENKHLPNVPSAQEVEQDGINVAEMDATLLRQIEELWLHVIDLKKENETLKVEVKNLQK